MQSLLILFIESEKSNHFVGMPHNNRRGGTPLPRIFMISSGEEGADGGCALIDHLSLLPSHIPCMAQIRELYG